MDTIHLSCAAERNYVAHSAAMLVSALRNRGDAEVCVHYLHGPRFPRRGRRKLEEMVTGVGGSISFLEIGDREVAGLPTVGFTRKATWYRVFLPELLPDIDKLLYLDVDTIVRADLGPLWATELGEHYLGAVTNVFQWDHVDRPAKLGLEPNEYFNAGVLLMNLRLMRRDGCSSALRAFAIENVDRIDWRDQDTLNLVLGKRRLPLHPRWNVMNSVLLFPSSVDVFGAEAVEEARRNPGIRHFEGQGVNKPWHVDCERADRGLYLELRRQTPWPKVTLEGRRPRDRAARLFDRVRPYAMRARGWLGRIRRRLRSTAG